MRLTLRTMLAYLDDILDPQDAKDLGAKIEESEFATALVQRIRNCTRRLRLGAPKLDGKGVGLDPNTVAEYLDNTLTQDRVPDFEKVCLESDVHLAEVASCHQILTLVLGEPATVEPHLRDRIYQLPSEAAVGTAAAGASGTELAAASTNGSSATEERPAIVTKRPEVPDYLRVARRRSWKPIAATVTLALLLVLAALLALGRLDENHPLLGGFFEKETPENAVARQTGDDQPRDADTSSVSEADSDDVAIQSDQQSDAATDDGDVDSVQPDETTINIEIPSNLDDTADADTTESAATADSTASDVVAIDVSDSSDLDTTTGEIDTSTPPEESTTSEGTLAADATVSDSGSSAEGTEATVAPPDSAADSSATPETPESTSEVGRYIAGDRKHVLSRFDSTQGWLRLPEREVLHAGDELLALPSYRPQIAMTSGVQLTVVGPSRVTVVAPDEMAAPVLRLTNATLLIDTVGVAGSQIVIETPDRRAHVTFATPDATLAVQVQRQWPLGTDPMAIEAVYVCRMMATNGQLEWRDQDQPPITIHSGQTLIAVGADVPQVADSGSLPAWVSNTDISEIELRASKELETMIDPSRSLGLNLAERVDHRQVEVAALAIASLCTMEEFEPCIEAFRDERFRSYWKSLYDRIQWALSGDVSAAERLLAAMEKNRPDEARTLYELVCGYDNQQLEAGADKRLVGLLQSRSMDVRVLAFENLRRITGRPLNYRPENEPAQQRRALQDWQNRLERGQIRWPTETAG